MDHAEGVEPQSGQRVLGSGIVDDQKQIVLIFVGGDLRKLCQISGLAQLVLQCAEFHGGRDSAQDQLGVRCAHAVQRHIHPAPGSQIGQIGLELVFGGVDPGDLPGTLVDALGTLKRLRFDGLTEEVCLGDLLALDEQPLFGGGIFLQRVQRAAQRSRFRLSIGQGGAVPPQQGRPLRVGQLVFRFRDLDAPQVKQLLQ